jgi:hypothetical protein
MDINETLAVKVLSVIDAGLVSGLGKPIPGQMCVEAAVNYAMGLPHGDNPSCVASALRSLKIRLNDARWPSKKARTAGLRRLGLAQLGSAGVLDEREFARRCAALAIQTLVPIALRAAAARKGNAKHKDALLTAALACEQEPTLENARKAKAAAAVYADAAVYAAAAVYADADADAAAYAAVYADAAADAAVYAAVYADAAADADADAAAAAAAYAAVYAAVYADADAARTKILSDFAEGVVQILIDMKAPGCQWLYLTEVQS